MPWHSTQRREELLIVLAGRVQLQMQPRRSASRQDGMGRVRTMSVRAGECVFLPSETLHQVVNRSKSQVRYLYVTAPTQRGGRRPERRGLTPRIYR